MKELGIQFSAPMVRAILDGRKTQTRRIVDFSKIGPSIWIPDSTEIFARGDKFQAELKRFNVRSEPFGCKYGPPGRRLWVRETWRVAGEFADMTVAEIKAMFFDPGIALKDKLQFRADGKPYDGTDADDWRPSIFMPRFASRINLEVTEIRVERLQDISESDCLAEGIESVDGMFDVEIYAMAKRIGVSFEDSKPTYACLWESINGPGSWDANPFIWVISFKVIP